MNNLDERKRNANLPKSENMIQYAYGKYNNTKDTIESIKLTSKIYREVQNARREYLMAREASKVKDEQQTPIVTAKDIQDEMYR